MIVTRQQNENAKGELTQCVSFWRDRQLQVSKTYTDLKKIEVNDFENLVVTFYL